MRNRYPQVISERLGAGFGIVVLVLLHATLCRSQSSQPVKWDMACNPVTQPEAVITLSATMAPGWHIYSQFMEKGGPFPTHFVFEQSDAYTLIGKPEEKGAPTKFYDDTFEMEIIWYEQEVSFLQKIILHEPEATVKGKVEYMICNDTMCIPAEQEFSIAVKP